MPTQINAVDQAQAQTTTSSRGARRGGASGLFDEIMSQLNRASLGAGQTATADNKGSDNGNDLASGQQSPIKSLEKSLRATGQPLENYQVASADREKLQKVLLQSGYRGQDVTQMMDKASNADGSVNLGVLFANLAQYQPTQGSMLLLSQNDAPLLTQVLKDLGLDQDKIQEFMDKLPKDGDKLVVQGLPELLAQADPNQAKSLDQSQLGDLLGRLGLDQSQVQSLLKQASDNQGRTTPPALMAMFNVAAQRQEQGLGQSLQDLAARLQMAKASQGQGASADQLRAQVIQNLQKIEANVGNQTDSLSKQFHMALEQANSLLGASSSQGQGLALGQNLALGQGAGQGFSAMIAQALGQTEAATLAANMAGKAAQHHAAGVENAEQSAGVKSAAGATAGAAGEAGQAAGEGRAQAATARPVSGAQAGAQAGGDLNFAAQNQAAMADEVAPTQAALPAYVVRQVGQQISEMVSRQENSLRLELKPPSLGELNVELSVKDGVLKATMITDTVAAKQMLENGLDQLKQQLTLQGLKVEQVDIMVNPDALRQQAQNQAQNQDGFGRRSQGGQSGGGSESSGLEGLDGVSAAILSTSAGNGRINLFA